MKQTEQFSVGGYAFTLEKDASAALQEYIATLEKHYLPQEGGKEIMEGIEERAAELLLDQCGRTGVVTLPHVQHVIHVIGRPERIEADDPGSQEAQPGENPRHLYRDLENKRLGGVCAGLAAYLQVDVVIFRLAFVVLSVLGLTIPSARGAFVITFPFIYCILWVCMPAARTAQERWSMRGTSVTADEISRIAAYMGPGNNFYAPYYRHTTIEAFVTQNEDTVNQRMQLPLDDVRAAFHHFLLHRDPSRPFILAGFSQGAIAVIGLLKDMDDQTYSQLAAAYVMGWKITPQDTLQTTHIKAAKGESDTGVTICYNTVKAPRYAKPLISASCIAINPVNWHTDTVSALLHDTIRVSLCQSPRVLVVSGYSGSEYRPYRGIINTGDIHSCEPWLYSQCIARNIAIRTQKWRSNKQ